MRTLPNLEEIWRYVDGPGGYTIADMYKREAREVVDSTHVCARALSWCVISTLCMSVHLSIWADMTTYVGSSRAWCD